MARTRLMTAYEECIRFHSRSCTCGIENQLSVVTNDHDARMAEIARCVYNIRLAMANYDLPPGFEESVDSSLLAIDAALSPAASESRSSNVTPTVSEGKTE